MATQQAGQFMFPQQIMYHGEPWILVYDPGNPNNIVPNIQGFSLDGDVVCDPVSIQSNGIKQNAFMVSANLSRKPQMTAGKMIAGKQLKAFRIYASKPVAPDTTPPEEMAFYMRAVQIQYSEGNASQEFLDAIMGVALSDVERKNKINPNWAQEILPAVSPSQQQQEQGEDIDAKK